jgi:indole-3-glycerol phosphate synthase
MSILTKIIARKQVEVAALDVANLRRAAETSPTPRDFIALLQSRRVGRRPGLIAELKRASPSKGLLAPHLDLLEAAEIYAANGAAAVSVLTDETFFQGSLDTLRSLRFTRKIKLPLLRKDFIIDASQMYEARINGADAVLLIAAALTDDAQLADLHTLALELGLTPLVEVHNGIELERILKLKELRLVGINNRDLDTFTVTLETTKILRPLIPSGIAVVSESGIFTSKDVERMERAGVDAVLVGEALVTAPDMATRVRELTGIGLSLEELLPS